MVNVIGTVTLVCFFLANPLFTLAQLPAVLDTNRQPLEYGTPYYILPSGGGGGLTLVSRNTPCPLFVGQENSSIAIGLPVIFTPFTAGERTIGEASNFRVAFDAATTCIQSTEWVLQSNPVPERTLLGTGGRNGVLLRIDRDSRGYRLGYCPPSVGRPRCGEVGVYVENGKRLLALYVPGLPVVFRKA